MLGFDYPALPHQRRHGPAGYKDYGSYRDWLRDEFMFRCVYCLHREQWYSRGGTFHIDHAVPVRTDLGGALLYTNLVYACTSCNQAKGAILGLPDPCSVCFRDCLEIASDGRVTAKNEAGKKLRDVLRMNSSINVQHRYRTSRILETLLRDGKVGLFEELMGFPSQLPDLRLKRVPGNDRPEGLEKCCFALRERGELPRTY